MRRKNLFRYFETVGYTRELYIADQPLSLVNGTVMPTEEIPSFMWDGSFIKAESLEIKSSLWQGDQLVFGGCQSKQVTFYVRQDADNIFGKTIWMYFLVNDGENNKALLPMGNYVVYYDQGTNDSSWRKVTGYDKLYALADFNVAEWYADQFPYDESETTVREMLNSLVAYIGIDKSTRFRDAHFVNDTVRVYKTLYSDLISAYEVLHALGEINGAFFQLNERGQMDYVLLPQRKNARTLYPSDSVFPDDDLFPLVEIGYIYSNDLVIPPTKYENYLVRGINSLMAYDEDGKLSGYFTRIPIGQERNTYSLVGNFLLFERGGNDVNTILGNLWNQIKNITFRPATVTVKGNPCLELGDAVFVPTSKGSLYTIITGRTQKGIQCLYDNMAIDCQEFQPAMERNLEGEVSAMNKKLGILSQLPKPDLAYNVEAVGGNGNATVSWSVPSGVTRCSIVYKKGSYPVAPTDGTQIQNVTSPYVVTGLNNDTTYYFRVITWDSNNQWSKSLGAWATPVTSQSYPTGIGNLKLLSGVTNIECRYTLPADATGVRLVYKKASEGIPMSLTDGQWIDTESSDFCEITGLDHETAYNVVPYTFNSVGNYMQGTYRTISTTDIASWSDSTWEHIRTTLNNHYQGSIDLADYPEKWGKNMYRLVDLNACSDGGIMNTGQPAQSRRLVIIDLKHDDLASGGKTAVTIAIDALQNNMYWHHDLNLDQEGKWSACDLRAWLNGAFLNMFPAELLALSKQFKKTCSSFPDASSDTREIVTLIERVSLPSSGEMNGYDSYCLDGGTNYAYYGDNMIHSSNSWTRTPQYSRTSTRAWANKWTQNDWRPSSTPNYINIGNVTPIFCL